MFLKKVRNTLFFNYVYFDIFVQLRSKFLSMFSKGKKIQKASRSDQHSAQHLYSIFVFSVSQQEEYCVDFGLR